MEEKYLLAKKTVSSKFNEDYEYYPMLILGLTVLLIKYSKYEKELLELFLNSSFYIEDKDMKDIVNSHNLDDGNRDDYDKFTIYGFSHNGVAFWINETEEIERISLDPYIAISSKKAPKERILNVFLHEMLHLLKSIKNPFNIYKMDDDVTAVLLKSGFNNSIHIIDKKSNDIYVQTQYETFDEVINTLQTTELMELIIALDDIIPDKLVADYLKSLDADMLKKDYGYEIIVPSFKSLWEIPSFKKMIEDNIIEGEIDIVSTRINAMLGEGELELFCDCLDYIDYYQDEDHTEPLEIIQEFVNKYKQEDKNNKSFYLTENI